MTKQGTSVKARLIVITVKAHLFQGGIIVKGHLDQCFYMFLYLRSSDIQTLLRVTL